MKKIGQSRMRRCMQVLRDPYVLALLAIVLTGFVLRVWGVSFGLPFTYHMDEGFEVNRALQLANGSFDFSRIAKGGYFYVLFIEYGFLFVLMKVSGFVDTTRDFALWFVNDPSIFYLVGRVTTAVIGTLCLVLTYRLGEKYQSRGVGLLAALMLCVNILHAQHSHYITVDIPLTCLCLAAMLCIFNVADGKAVRNYFWAALFIALAATTKLPGILLMLPFFFAHLVRQHRNGGHILASIFSRQWWRSILVFVIVYLITTPGIVVNFKPLLSIMLGIYGLRGDDADATADDGGAETGGDSDEVTDFDPFSFYTDAVFDSMGLAAFVLGLVGMFYGVYRDRVKGGIIASFVIIFFAALALSARADLAYTRYVLPFVPMFLLLAAGLLFDAATLVTRHLKVAAPLTLAGFASLIVVVPGIAGIKQVNERFGTVDSRTLAKQWFEVNVPEESKVLIEGFTAQVYRGTIPLSNTSTNIQAAIDSFLKNGEKGKAKYFELELETQKRKRYDLTYYIWFNLEDWSEYKSEGVEFVVVRPKFLVGSVNYGNAGEEFYGAVKSDADFKLEETFLGAEDGGAGPRIEIYKRR